MNRREALKRFTYLLGGATIATDLVLLAPACGSNGEKKASRSFSEGEEAVLAELADTLIPDTDIPGAKAAGVGSFITMMLIDCYAEEVREVIMEGVAKVEETSDSLFGKQFVGLDQGEREKILERLGKEMQAEKKKDTSEGTKRAAYFFQVLRDLTFLGYFTSEIGATQALDYVEVPGRYDACIPLEEGQRAWSA